MQIHETGPEELDDVIELVLSRCPQYNRALVEPPVTDPTISEDRVMLTATDRGRVVGFGVQLHLKADPDGMFTETVAVAESHLGGTPGVPVHPADGVAAACRHPGPRYIRSGAVMPSRPSPCSRTASVTPHSRSREVRSDSSGALSTGQRS